MSTPEKDALAVPEPGDSSADSSKTRRNKLREFYRLQQQQQQQQDEDRKSSFTTAEEFFNNMKSADNVVSVVNADAKIVQEIKTLSSQNKALVYDNYDKLISVSTVLQKLHDPLAAHLKEIEKLRPVLTEVESIANASKSK